jgi:DNA invertase Pin-like site-specific DNA recombinase
MAMVADEERRMISKRTKDALAAAKARGKKLGGNRGNLSGGGTKGHAASLATRQAQARSRASDLAPVIEELKASGAVSLRQIAAGLNARDIKAARGGEWSAFQVQRVMEHIA